MISQGNSGSVVKVAGVRYGGPRFELWQVFPTFFVHLFYSVMTALLEYLGSR